MWLEISLKLFYTRLEMFKSLPPRWRWAMEFYWTVLHPVESVLANQHGWWMSVTTLCWVGIQIHNLTRKTGSWIVRMSLDGAIKTLVSAYFRIDRFRKLLLPRRTRVPASIFRWEAPVEQHEITLSWWFRSGFRRGVVGESLCCWMCKYNLSADL